MSGDLHDEVAITVGSRRIVGWETVSVTRSAEHLPNSFVLTASDPFPYDAKRAVLFPEGPGERCLITIGSDVLVTGYVDRYATQVGPDHHVITVTGRGLCEDLVDCSIDPTTPGLLGATFTAASAFDVATKLSAPFGIKVQMMPADLDKGPFVGTLTAALGESPFELIERVCRYAGFLVYEDETGTLILAQVGTNKMASGFTMPGNIEGATAELAYDVRFSRYIVVYSTTDNLSFIGPIANQIAVVQDAGVRRNRPQVIQSEQTIPGLTFEEFAKKRGQWEMARRIGRSQAINLTCDSWRDSAGKLWQPNYRAPINAPALKIQNAEWLIATVTFRKDADGTHSDITLMPPDAFNPEPTALHLFDYQTMKAIQDANQAPPSTEPPPGSPGAPL